MGGRNSAALGRKRTGLEPGRSVQKPCKRVDDPVLVAVSATLQHHCPAFPPSNERSSQTDSAPNEQAGGLGIHGARDVENHRLVIAAVRRLGDFDNLVGSHKRRIKGQLDG